MDMKLGSDLEVRKPGMRIVKTIVAVFLCLLVSIFRDSYLQNTFFACVAAIVTLKGSMEDSRFSSITRLEGTFMGGLFGLLALQLQYSLNLKMESILYCAILAGLVGVLLWVMTTFLHAQGAALACITMLSIAINHGMDSAAWKFAFHRFVDTLIGVVIALLINHILPSPHGNQDHCSD